MFSSSYIELSKSALSKNIRFLRKELGSDVLISSVIKGNAYGHEIETFVPLAEECGMHHFSVFSAEEALRAFKSIKKQSEIMIVGSVANDALEWAIENNISFYIFNLERLEKAVVIARRLKTTAKIHLELETGLNRTGLYDELLEQALDLILKNKECFEIKGVCTHYAGAESIANYKRINDQLTTFKNQCALIASRGIKTGMLHTASSAAALSYPETRMDMVRIGIAHYGFWPSKEIEMQHIMGDDNYNKQRYVDPLKRVLSWKSKIMNLEQKRLVLAGLIFFLTAIPVLALTTTEVTWVPFPRLSVLLP